MVAILTAEAWILIWHFQQPPAALQAPDPSRQGLALFLMHPKALWQILLWWAGIWLLLMLRRLPALASDLAPRDRPSLHPIWLCSHGLAYLFFFLLSRRIFDGTTDSLPGSDGLAALWLCLGLLLGIFWLLTLAPLTSWIGVVTRERTSIAAGIGLGTLGWFLFRTEGLLAGHSLWQSFAKPTLWVVYTLLRATYPEVVYQPQDMVVGTPQFEAEIYYTCSGYEGISLFLIFLSVYLWAFRADLRFPQVFWLIPIGVAATYALNVLRITILIMIGTSISSEVAVGGFHSQAGWISVTLAAFCTILLLRRVPAFSVRLQTEARPIGKEGSLASALLVPFLVLMATSMVVAAGSAGFEALYPLKAITTGLALWLYRDQYRRYRWTPSWHAVLIGSVVFAAWILAEEPADSGSTTAAGLGQLSPLEAGVWLGFRALNSSLIVPLAEEFAFRGYLLRRLAFHDFDDARAERFSWLACIGSSLLFGALHGRWIAASAAGLAYAVAFYHRRRLADAVWAHVTTNSLIAVYAIGFRHWTLWD